MRVVVDAQRRAVGELDPRRALDLREQQVGLAFQPGDLQPAAGDGAVLDLGAVVIGHQLAPADLAIHRAAVRQADRALVLAAHEQVGRAAIDRNIVDVGLVPRAIEHRARNSR